MTRSEAVPGAVVVRVRLVVTDLCRVVAVDMGEYAFLDSWRNGRWAPTVGERLERLRLATAEERKEAGLDG